MSESKLPLISSNALYSFRAFIVKGTNGRNEVDNAYTTKYVWSNESQTFTARVF